MPRSSQLAANDAQSRSPAASRTACICGARAKAKPSRLMVSAIAAKKSVIRNFPLHARLMRSWRRQFHTAIEPRKTGLECEASYTRKIKFGINAILTSRLDKHVFLAEFVFIRY